MGQRGPSHEGRWHGHDGPCWPQREGELWPWAGSGRGALWGQELGDTAQRGWSGLEGLCHRWRGDTRRGDTPGVPVVAHLAVKGARVAAVPPGWDQPRPVAPPVTEWGTAGTAARIQPGTGGCGLLAGGWGRPVEVFGGAFPASPQRFQGMPVRALPAPGWIQPCPFHLLGASSALPAPEPMAGAPGRAGLYPRAHHSLGTAHSPAFFGN